MSSGVEQGKLNDAAVRRWLKGGVTRDFRDARYPEIRLRAAAKRAKASVYLVLNTGGETRWQKLGSWPNLCLKTLITDLPVMLSRRLSDSMATGQFDTVGEVVVWYQRHIQSNSTFSDNWRANVKSMSKCQLIPRIGQLRLCELSYSAIDSELVKTMLSDELAPNYIAQAVNQLKSAFASAAELRKLQTNPVAGYKVTSSIKLHQAKDTRLFETDFSQLFTQLGEASMPVSMLFLMMMMFGTRINETRQARWEYFAGDTWVIPSSHAKNKEEHRLPLTSSAQALIKHYKRWQLKHVGKRAYLFPGVKGPISIRTAHDWSLQIRFKHFTSHDLRILFRTMLADLGIDTVIGERLVNHALPVLLRTYVKSTLEKGMIQALELYHAYLIEQGFSRVAPEILPRSSQKVGKAQTQLSCGWVT